MVRVRCLLLFVVRTLAKEGWLPHLLPHTLTSPTLTSHAPASLTCIASHVLTTTLLSLRSDAPPEDGDTPAHIAGQVLGWQESITYLGNVLRDRGPFDGVLGFSQGAGVAAALCAAQQAGHGEVAGTEPLHFALLFSGHLPVAPELRALLARAGPLRVPSLHCFGDADRQLASPQHVELEGAFDPMARTTVRHDLGHIIPSQRGFVQRYVRFLAQVDMGRGDGGALEAEGGG